MSTPLTDIPELQFETLVAAARARLPSLCPAWTDHGPADLGVTLIELFAAIAEMVRYRTRRETPAMTRAFLELLAGPDVAQNPDLALATRLALAQIWTPYRAVTPEDYESLTRDAWPHSPEAAPLAAAARVHLVRCLPERDVTAASPLAVAPGHVSLVVVPEQDLADPAPLLAALTDFFEPRRLLTTRHHVALPRAAELRIAASIYLDDDVAPAVVLARLTAALTTWLGPRVGGDDGNGWPLGADVFVSDVYGLLDAVPGVDFVTDVAVTTPLPDRVLRGPNDAPVGVRVHPHEQVRFAAAESKLRLFEPTGEQWKEIKP